MDRHAAALAGGDTFGLGYPALCAYNGATRLDPLCDQAGRPRMSRRRRLRQEPPTMTQTPVTPAAPKPEPSFLYRWIVLVGMSVASYGSYYAFDYIGPLAPLLSRQLNFSDSQIGLLQAVYSFPNMVTMLVCGVIIDRIGTRKSLALFAVLVFGGLSITALSPSIGVMAAGRLLVGTGAEALALATTSPSLGGSGAVSSAWRLGCSARSAGWVLQRPDVARLGCSCVRLLAVAAGARGRVRRLLHRRRDHLLVPRLAGEHATSSAMNRTPSRCPSARCSGSGSRSG